MKSVDRIRSNDESICAHCEMKYPVWEEGHCCLSLGKGVEPARHVRSKVFLLAVLVSVLALKL